MCVSILNLAPFVVGVNYFRVKWLARIYERWAARTKPLAAGIYMHLMPISGLQLSCRIVIMKIGGGLRQMPICAHECQRIGDYWGIKLTHLLYWHFVCFSLLLRNLRILNAFELKGITQWQRNRRWTSAAHSHCIYTYIYICIYFDIACIRKLINVGVFTPLQPVHLERQASPLNERGLSAFKSI